MFIFKFMILVSLQLTLSLADEFPECRIGSNDYFLTAERSLRANKGGRITAGHKLGLFVEPNQCVWQFVSIPDTKNHFRLRNMKYKNEELYASDNFSGMNPFNMKKRRNVYTKEVGDAYQDIDEFVWVFKPLENEPGKFYIINKKYREPLFLGSWVIYSLIYFYILKCIFHIINTILTNIIFKGL